ncbi:PAP2-domain-containing protein [Macrolepiota fuliginosa MF-IS2]|uniref:Dolichyldiphosphatase n=1 Tax=Macrolepiota fuliginosa MF-IS2 TaxID=1400762 RepID=A0A9P5XDU5_9AGAR|nr:PAP2-domain-containing protein [Macrolepiota fuliginosa MF-IS2]
MQEGPSASLDLTHVLYDDDSILSLGFALVTLSPVLLMASYAALAVQTREYLVIVMWAGQFFGEVLNYAIKRVVKQDRPIQSIGNGYGFPSSHSQYMAYFATFLTCHLFFKHRFASTGSKIFDQLWRLVVYAGLLAWAGVVAYSRHHLGYHSWYQIIWGLGIGSVLGISLYLAVDLIPTKFPTSLLGHIKRFVLDHPLSRWLQIRDGWEIWADGGREDEWLRWRAEWEKRQRSVPDGWKNE